MRPLVCSIILMVNSVLAQEVALPLTRQWLDMNRYERQLPDFDERTRQQMIEELRRASSNANATARYGPELPILAMDLGDAALIKDLAADKFLSPRWSVARGAAGLLREVKNPAVIPAIAQHLSRQEPPDMIFNDDVAYPPPSVRAASTILHVISKSEHFQPATRNWAGRSLVAPSSDAERRELLRAFWASNQDHFTNQRYNAITPPGMLAPAPGTKSPAAHTAPDAINPSVVPAIARPHAKRAAVAPPQPSDIAVPPAAPPSTASTLTSKSLWPWVLVTGGGLLVWLASRQR